MKKLFGAFILASVLLTLGFVSADVLPACTSQTIVAGTIYKDVIANPVGGATVDVTCNETTISNVSLTNGAYSVVFDCTQCTYEDEVTVHAKKDGVGENTAEGEVDMSWEIPCGIKLDIGIVNVPLVPEFGTVIGVLTALGALGAFFVVRRK